MYRPLGSRRSATDRGTSTRSREVALKARQSRSAERGDEGGDPMVPASTNSRATSETCGCFSRSSLEKPRSRFSPGGCCRHQAHRCCRRHAAEPQRIRDCRFARSGKTGEPYGVRLWPRFSVLPGNAKRLCCIGRWGMAGKWHGLGGKAGKRKTGQSDRAISELLRNFRKITDDNIRLRSAGAPVSPGKTCRSVLSDWVMSITNGDGCWLSIYFKKAFSIVFKTFIDHKR